VGSYFRRYRCYVFIVEEQQAGGEERDREKNREIVVFKEIKMELKGKVIFSSGKAGDYDLQGLNFDSKKLTQLTSGNFWNDAPRRSANGRYLIYVSNRSGLRAERLVIMDLESAKID